MLILRTNVGMPPGGIIYNDPRTPSAKWNDTHTSAEERTQEIIRFRLANPNIYPEPEWTDARFVLQQVIDANCARLGNDRNYCLEEANIKSRPYVPPAARTCPDCDVVLGEVHCATCSGKRVIGYKCPSCNKEYPK